MYNPWNSDSEDEILYNPWNSDTEDEIDRIAKEVLGDDYYKEWWDDECDDDKDFLYPYHDPDKKTQTADGCSSLWKATGKGHLECVKELLKSARKWFTDSQIRQRANPYPIEEHHDPISLATQLGNWQIIEVLSDLYKDASAEEVGFALHMACELDEIKCVEVLAKKLPQLVNSVQPGRFSDEKDAPINIAVGNEKSFEMVKILVEAGADVNYVGSPGCRTPFYQAICEDDVDTVKYLLNNGADPTFGGTPRFPDCEEDTYEPIVGAVFAWCDHESMELFKLVADTALREHGAHAVIEAVVQGKYECLKYLLEKGFPMFNPNDDKHPICLWGSMLSKGSLYRDSSETVDLLLQHGADFWEFVEMLDFGALLKKRGSSQSGKRPGSCLCGGRKETFTLGQLEPNTLKVFLDHGLVEMQYESIVCPRFEHFAKNFKRLVYHFIVGDTRHSERAASNFLLYMKYFPFAIFSKNDVPIVPDFYYDSEYGYGFFRSFAKERLMSRNLEIMDGDVVQKLPKLKEMCRWQIRCSLVHAQGSKLANNVEKLPLPKAIKSYLMYK